MHQGVAVGGVVEERHVMNDPWKERLRVVEEVRELVEGFAGGCGRKGRHHWR
jgi:hypothetical protein